MKVGIVICSHAKSKRLPHKPFRKIAGKSILDHLLSRLRLAGLDIILAVPTEEVDLYQPFVSKSVKLWHGYADSPLHRMYYAAFYHELDVVIRVTHDKILVDPDTILEALERYTHQNQYVYSSHLPDGAGFEIFSKHLLERAVTNNEKPVEHISYAIRALNPEMIDYKPSNTALISNDRFLIDYPEDENLIKVLLRDNPDLSLTGAIKRIKNEPHLSALNEMPLITFYTCVRNGADHIGMAMASVYHARRDLPNSSEYIIVDDASTDDTMETIINNRSIDTRLIVNDENEGLASSSNKALALARGKYIMRLDADDELVPYDIYDLIQMASRHGCEAIYPAFHDGTYGTIGDPTENHHVGGALFLTKAMRHFQFTERLRGYEGLDFFNRAKDTLKIGYFSLPTWFYRHRKGSMSRNETPERKAIKEKLDAGITGEGLVNG